MSFIQLSKSNFFHNLSVVEKKVGSKDKISVVIKDNAYGHGIDLISQMSKEYGIKKAIVRNINEAQQVLKYFDEIIVLNCCGDNHIDKKISQVINSMSDIDIVAMNSKVELKIDTNMHRNGIVFEDIKKALEKIKNKKLILNGVMTHFASADISNDSIDAQEQIFEDVKKYVINFCNLENLKIPLFHSCNSSASFRQDNVQDFVRVGICIYGYVYTAPSVDAPSLKPVMSLWADLISQRDLKQGDSIGYGDSGVLDKDEVIGNYDIGYGDGFLRLNEKHNYNTPNNSKIIGRMSMDNFSANCIDKAICVFDDASQLANIFDTITYDVLVKLKENIKRVIV